MASPRPLSLPPGSPAPSALLARVLLVSFGRVCMTDHDDDRSATMQVERYLAQLSDVEVVVEVKRTSFSRRPEAYGTTPVRVNLNLRLSAQLASRELVGAVVREK